MLKAIRPIGQGEEVLVNYGNAYGSDKTAVNPAREERIRVEVEEIAAIAAVNVPAELLKECEKDEEYPRAAAALGRGWSRKESPSWTD